MPPIEDPPRFYRWFNSFLLGSRWFHRTRCVMAGRTLPDHWRMNTWRHGHHNWMMATLLAVWVWLKSFRGALPKHAHVVHEPDWLKILNLLAKIGIICLKLKYARVKLAILSRRSIKRARDDRQLLFQQVNYILGQPCRTTQANNLFCGVECTHNLERSNDDAQAQRAERVSHSNEAQSRRSLRHPG